MRCPLKKNLLGAVVVSVLLEQYSGLHLSNESATPLSSLVSVSVSLSVGERILDCEGGGTLIVI